MCGVMWDMMYIILYIIVCLCLGYLMLLYWYIVLCWYDFIVCFGMWSCLLLCASRLFYFVHGFIVLCPDFIVIDIIYYFLIAYNVWLYIYVFRRILLFLYVVECWFSLVFIGFMLFMVLWSYFLFMQNFTIVHGRMYWRTKIPHRGIFCINCI